MDSVCPSCNNITSIEIRCPRCSNVLNDMGRYQDFYDPYSAYLDRKIYAINDQAGENECAHLFYCRNCGLKVRKKFAEILF